MPPKAPSSRGEYIETETGNKISRRATILGPKHIMLAGKCVIQENVVVHGDLVRTTPSSKSTSSTTESKDKEKLSSPDTTSIHLGRYVFISQGCVLHPPSRMSASAGVSITASGEQINTGPVLTYYPLRMADHIYIGPNTVVRSAEIRSNVCIGANCVIGNMTIIKDNVKILDGSVLPANSVWVSGSVVAGAPARVVGELGEAWGGSSGGAGNVAEEGVGVRSRERWASVGNKK